MNYIVLNGVHSNTVNGLLIQKLPPITKPLIRTQVEEIDGRDGDIVTPLGYAAYDKQIEIGLHGKFNVDDAISFFDSKGTVVFSNEPDKYYRYKIIEAIDFEKLVRFRTATVTFHVQPFKYSAIDEKQTIVSQLIHMDDAEITSGDVTVTIADDTIHISGEGRAQFYIPLKPITVEVGKEYTLKTYDATSNCLVRVVGTVATDADSFGGTSIIGDGEVTDIPAEERTYNYLYVRVSGQSDFTLDVSLFEGDEHQITVVNRGNAKAKPTITVYGNGIIYLYLNNEIAFVLVINNQYMTIDVDAMNAYRGEVYMNRYVSGDYNNLMLKQGRNTISWVGNVKRIEVENYARWI